MSVKKISEAILGVGVDDTTIDLFESQYLFYRYWQYKTLP